MQTESLYIISIGNVNLVVAMDAVFLNADAILKTDIRSGGEWTTVAFLTLWKEHTMQIYSTTIPALQGRL